jgi:PIN domain nuclease of toxin-antitoxin system
MTGADELFVSSASLWEMSIKTSLGRLQIDWDLLLTGLRAMHVRELRISWEHALALKRLPLVSKDPFDRMLIAQAITEPLVLLTRDHVLSGYGDCVMLV